MSNPKTPQSVPSQVKVRAPSLRATPQKWAPKPKAKERPRYKKPEIIKAMQEATCEDLGCRLGKSCDYREVVWPSTMRGIPVLHCTGCKQQWTPVDLSLLSEEEAVKIISELAAQ